MFINAISTFILIDELQIVFMRKLLEFCEEENPLWWNGVIYAIGFALMELCRVMFFAVAWGTSYRFSKKFKIHGFVQESFDIAIILFFAIFNVVFFFVGLDMVFVDLEL